MTEGPISIPESPGFALLGDDHAVLLAGPDEGCGAERLSAHVGRLGELPCLDLDALIGLASDSGLVGRGGGGFPTARKLAAVRDAVQRNGRRPVVVVNGSESEPASRKDRTLLAFRPHLVLDGAALAATALGATETYVRVHRGSAAVVTALAAARAERLAAGRPEPAATVSAGPGGYVAGESTAVVSGIEGRPALPRFGRVPVAERGVDDRPTFLLNAETVAHLAVLARTGPAAWRRRCATGWSGPSLVTVEGSVTEPGLVAEVVGPLTVGDLLAGAGGCRRVAGAVLVGGFAGGWLSGVKARRLPLDRTALAAAGGSFGCGLVAALPARTCGLAETARLTRWLAGESAGQCGPCAFGLPALADAVERLAFDGGRQQPDRIARLLETVAGRGACRHPDGVVALVSSALRVFATDVERHRVGGPCPEVTGRPMVRTPARQEGRR